MDIINSIDLSQIATADLLFKRGSVQPGCILGGVRFRSTAIRFFKLVWYFQQQVLREFFLRNGSNKIALRDGRRLRNCGHRVPASSAFVHPLRDFSLSCFAGKTHAKWRNRGCTTGGGGGGPSLKK
jgi:hypothetical protein